MDRCPLDRCPPEIKPYIIPNAERTGVVLGIGSYAKVEEVRIGSTRFAGKIRHQAFSDLVLDAIRGVEQVYLECGLHSRLRHPHVVQFLGISFLPNERFPILLTERMECSLDHVLEESRDIPPVLKVLILQDVAKGLEYLHNVLKPPIIHRDISTSNVLLDVGMRAKISGFFRACSEDPDIRACSEDPNLLNIIKKCPGNKYFMPPEAFGDWPEYDRSSDIFSFGHLCLCLSVQKFIDDLKLPTFHDRVSGCQVARTEVRRRAFYFKQLSKVIDEEHRLVLLIKQCLHNTPTCRPTARQAIDTMDEIMINVRGFGEDSRSERIQLIKLIVIPTMKRNTIFIRFYMMN